MHSLEKIKLLKEILLDKEQVDLSGFRENAIIPEKLLRKVRGGGNAPTFSRTNQHTKCQWSCSQGDPPDPSDFFSVDHDGANNSTTPEKKKDDVPKKEDKK